MIRRMPLAVSAIILAGAFQPALAAPDALSSSYWEAAYLNGKIERDSEKITPEGFRLGASLGLMKFLNFTIDYDQFRYKDLRYGFGSAGLAYHTKNPVYQFFGGVTYERYELDNNDFPASDAEEEGYGVEIGGRYMLPNVELHAAYRYLDYGSVDRFDDFDLTGSRYGLGAEAQLCPWWSLLVDYRLRELKVKGGGSTETTDFNALTVGFRRYFVTDTDRRARHGGLLNTLFSGDDEAAPAPAENAE